MTKKDYIIIADVLAKISNALENGKLITDQNLIIDYMGYALQKDNPRFDWSKFTDYVEKRKAELKTL